MAEDRDLQQFAVELRSEVSDRALGDMDAGEFSRKHLRRRRVGTTSPISA